MVKAECLAPSEETGDAPRVACDFCKATFNLKTGAPVKAQQSAGFFGGIAKAVLSAQDSTPLPVYSLAEKNGKILFATD
jgi:nitrite reductase/ring-hydroxylating ferredoxin subunit